MVAGEVSLEEVAVEAVELGFDYIELHEATVVGEGGARRASALLGESNVRVSQLTSGTDFVSPDVSDRKANAEQGAKLVAMAVELGAANIRIVSGLERAGVSREDALGWAVEGMVAMGEAAKVAGVRLHLENHYRDRMWPEGDLDFARDPEVWLELVSRLPRDAVSVNFDTGQPMVMRTDPVSLLDKVLDRVGYVHAGDRKWGAHEHSTIGEGDVDFRAILERLAKSGYDGFIALEDATTWGREALMRSSQFLRSEIARAWSVAE
jgi:sugar phosphate isomerase/epimerase